MTTKEKLFLLKEETEKECSENALGFVGDYSLDNIHYLSDSFSEFADNNISVYYSDQFKYYEEHATECEDALTELYDPNSIAQTIKKDGLYNLCCLAGVCGEYNEITGELYRDEENIKKLLVIRYLIKNDIYNLTDEQLTELLEEAENSNDTPADLLELISKYLEENEEQ